MESLEAAGADALHRADEATQQLHVLQGQLDEQASRAEALETSMVASSTAEAAARARVEVLEQAAAERERELAALRSRLAAAEQGYARRVCCDAPQMLLLGWGRRWRTWPRCRRNGTRRWAQSSVHFSERMLQNGVWKRWKMSCERCLARWLRSAGMWPRPWGYNRDQTISSTPSNPFIL